MAIPAVMNTVWLQLEIKALPAWQSKQVGIFFRVSSVRKDKDYKNVPDKGRLKRLTALLVSFLFGITEHPKYVS